LILGFKNDEFIAKCTYEEREILRDYGFQWDSEQKFWCTQNPAVAAKLGAYATDKAKFKIAKSLIEVTPWLEPLPPSPLKLKPYQIEAIHFALERNRSYLALDPGLGKTAVAAVVSKALPHKVLYITPPFLIGNVKAEFAKWAPDMRVATLRDDEMAIIHAEVLVVPDSIILNKDILNYFLHLSIFKKFAVIIDEAHRFKTPEAKRTKALNTFLDWFDKIVFMSGTPMPNRPMELFPILSNYAPEVIDFKNWFQFGQRYCNGKKTEYGWDFTGASNVAELSQKMVFPSGPFMLRMRKDLLNLPPKIEEVFVLADDETPRLAKMGASIGNAYATIDDLIKKRLAAQVNTPDGEDLHTSKYRHLLGLEKATAALDYLKSILNETEENILLFAFHKDVIKFVADKLEHFQPLVVTGDTPSEKRLEAVNLFQNENSRRIIIGNYFALGIGFTITKADRVIFLEYDWCPGTNDQASDRAHRMGRKETVLVQYITYKNSLDKAVIETLLRKRSALKHV
jgi:SWI/SNF-related matrix-associated actin-dependent regulator of chromatin subfamily A-like protein 1